MVADNLVDVSQPMLFVNQLLEPRGSLVVRLVNLQVWVLLHYFIIFVVSGVALYRLQSTLGQTFPPVADLVSQFRVILHLLLNLVELRFIRRSVNYCEVFDKHVQTQWVGLVRLKYLAQSFSVFVKEGDSASWHANLHPQLFSQFGVGNLPSLNLHFNCIATAYLVSMALSHILHYK